MNQKTKRPPSVWISQIILGLYLLLFSLVTLSLLMWASLPILGILWIIFILSLFGGAFMGLTLRRSWGRWLTFALFSLMFLVSVPAQLVDIPGPFPRETPNNAAQAFGMVLGAALIIIPFGFLIYRRGFGQPASNFFNPPEDQDEMFEPPPPPTFTE